MQNSAQLPNGTHSFEAAEAIPLFARVRINASGKLALASDTDTDAFGTAQGEAFASGDWISVWKFTDGTGHQMIAAGAIDVGDPVYAAASGKVDDSGTVLVGVALSPAGTSGHYLTVIPSPAAVIGAVARVGLAQEDLAAYPLPLELARVWDAPQTNIPGTPATDDLGLVYNTFLTARPSIETGDLKNAGSTTRKCAFLWPVPPEYVAGETLTLRANAGMKTTVASAAATIDFEVARRAAATVDICATAATTINSLTAANKDFTLTPTNVVPGDLLEIVCSILVNDSATGTAVIGKLYSLTMLADIKG